MFKITAFKKTKIYNKYIITCWINRIHHKHIFQGVNKILNVEVIYLYDYDEKVQEIVHPKFFYLYKEKPYKNGKGITSYQLSPSNRV